jgi:hypothetical protein
MFPATISDGEGVYMVAGLVELLKLPEPPVHDVFVCGLVFPCICIEFTGLQNDWSTPAFTDGAGITLYVVERIPEEQPAASLTTKEYDPALKFEIVAALVNKF